MQNTDPDVLCLQEPKVADDAFPRSGFEELGYEVACHGQPTYNGVALISQLPMSDLATGLPFPSDDQARGMSALIGGIRIISIYVPNGRKVDSEHYRYKLLWLDALGTWLSETADPAEALVLAGDFNIAPDDRDVHDVEASRGQLLASDAERARFQALLDWGLTDSLREVRAEAGVYTWWDFRGGAFRFNRGLRIDHVLTTGPLRERIGAVECSRDDRKVRAGVAGPSDHIPVTLVLGS